MGVAEKSKHNIIITGSTSGIGLALAKRCADLGYRSLLLGRREWERNPFEGAEYARVDVTDGSALQQAIGDFEERWGAATLLVNNAGIMPLGRIDTQDPNEWQKVFDVNVIAMLSATQAVLPGMKAAGKGTIATISSIAGRNVYANHTAYSGSKFAVGAMMESMRREYAAYGVRFTTIAPGVVDTNLLSSVSDPQIVESYEEMKKRIDNGLCAKEVSDAVMYAYQLPNHVNVRELVIAPTKQES